ncbi:uncharacterized protein TNCT_54491 [Trichonephila clavata]|uniref:Uncharacterized protein n=1 Tax=Trichonephila clavata TaxID=2740835 RepID=A0A8X6LCR5_TRICU|nr:uncharacterized protein TNCT_54491 [Trichonephila clavata]
MMKIKNLISPISTRRETNFLRNNTIRSNGVISEQLVKCQNHGQNFVLRFLYLIDLQVDSNKTLRAKTLVRFVIFCMVLVNIEILVTTVPKLIFKMNDFYMKIAILQLIWYVMSSLIWYTLRRKRKQLTILLRILRKTNYLACTRSQTLVLALICCTPFFFAILTGISNTATKKGTVYGFQIDPSIYIVIKCIKYFSNVSVYPTWINFVTFLYCLICQGVCKLMRSLVSEVHFCPREEFTLAMRTNILTQVTRIKHILGLVQKVFFVPSFLVCVIHFCSCITVLVAAMFIKNVTDPTTHLKMVCLFINSFCGLLACLWTAGRLPIEGEKLRTGFRKKLCQKYLQGPGNSFSVNCLEGELIDPSSFLLTGCYIVYFRRSSILALAGTILTYSTLLISKN